MQPWRKSLGGIERGRRGPRILVIEDHGALGRFIVAALTSAGRTVIGPVDNQSSAIDGVRRRRFDLAVMDRTLQGQEAFAVADAILARRARLLLISGHPRSTLPERFRDVPFLQKPFTLQALLEAVEAILGQE